MAGEILKIHGSHAFDADEMLFVFVHIPKSGGTSFHEALRRMSADRYLLLVPGENNPDDIDRLWGIGGHFVFESPAVNISEKARVYATIVRDPFDRFMSFYRHVTTRYHHISAQNEAVREMSPFEFAKYLDSIQNRELANLQCNMIVGDIGATASEAIGRLRHDFSFVAAAEEQSRLLSEIAEAAGCDRGDVLRLNASPQGADPGCLDEAREFVLSLNQEDQKLYEYVVHQ